MPFIGNQPALSYTSFAVQHFTTSATTSYTLDHSVANENEIRLVINNVVQQPGSSYAYTASGTTLTLSAATSATDTMYAVFLGKAVQTVTPASGSVTNAMLAGSIDLTSKVTGTLPVANGGTNLSSGFKNGITMADQFRLSASLSNPGNGVIDTNLERPDNATFSKIGTGMTESSGVFTFPQTGLYLVSWCFVLLNLSDAAVNFYTQVSSDSGSSYDSVTRGITGNINSSNAYNMGTTFAYVNVTDASTFRVRFNMDSTTSATTLSGNTAYNVTHFTFIRLGDSQ